MPDSNAPSLDLIAALDPDVLRHWVDYQFADHAAAIAANLTRFERFIAATTNGIPDDFTAGHAADFAHALKKSAEALDETRTRIKKPVLNAQRLIDGEARKLADRVAIAVAEVEKRITAYLRIKEAEARERAEAEAARLQAEAERLAAEALRTGEPEDGDAVVEAFQHAHEAEALANARAIELTRTRGTQGTLTALKDNWAWEMEDIQKVPAAFLMVLVNDAMVRTAIRSGTREIPGLRIWNDAKAYVR